jgi:hypothetical protein
MEKEIAALGLEHWFRGLCQVDEAVRRARLAAKRTESLFVAPKVVA